MVFQRGRDEEFVGVVPGQLPVGDAPVRRVQGGPEWKGEVAVQFHPPAGVGPGQLGTVLDGVVDPRDLGAMMIDLSLRGWFDLRRVEQGDDWELTRKRPIVAAELNPVEVVLLQGIFGNAWGPIMLSQVKKNLAQPLRRCRDMLYQEVVERGWYRSSPHRTRVGQALFGRVPRTATGTAIRVQTLGFRKYLATAEADQIKFEEAADQFSRYLPYAMVFGIADRWAGVIGEVVRKAQLTDAAAVAAEFASDPMAWYLLDGILDLAELGASAVDLGEIFSDAGGLFDLGDGFDSLGEVFDGLGDALEGVFDLFDL